MNVPLSWLSDYVSLPSDFHEFTHRLTMIGHMLDKTINTNGETVIDLELRGNRADLFGLIGIARDIGTAWNTPIRLPEVELLPNGDPKSTLITVEAPDLVHRFTAFTATVRVGPSPEWLAKRLALYGMTSINNVVDITNYVMIETGIPIHAFDLHALQGNHLVVRRAKDKEQMTTFMGETITLSTEDLTLADEQSPQAITLVGSRTSGTTKITKEILLEAAVYNYASVRRTSRRLGIRTEAGTRLEKHLDPHETSFALARALFLLKRHANAEATSNVVDYYPTPKTAPSIDLPITETERLSGLAIPPSTQREILERLGCSVHSESNRFLVTVPTFRTDIEGSADLVEEILRIHGYEAIHPMLLNGEIPPEQTSPRIKQEDDIRDILVKLHLNEVITSSFVPTIHDPSTIHLENPPDPAMATLRPSLIPNLINYAKRLLNERMERVAIFELGNVFFNNNGTYTEERRLGIVMTGVIDTRSYGKTPRPISYFDLKGTIEAFSEYLGIQMDTTRIQQIESTIFAVEYSLDELLVAKKAEVKPYIIAPPHPPIIEDISFLVNPDTKTGDILEMIRSFHPLLVDATLLDAYENKRTFRVVYQERTKSISTEETRPIREDLIRSIVNRFNIQFNNSVREPVAND